MSLGCRRARARAGGWLAVAALFVVPSARAEPGGDAAPHSERQGLGRASIVLVGEGTQAELGLLLFELLGRQAVTAELSRVDRFERSLLFDAPADDARVNVFIVLGSNAARLYFRGPGGERFLLRNLALPNGLDAVGKEAIGQVVESSTLALLRSSEAGVDRAQASAEVENDTETDAASASAKAARDERPPPPAPGSESAARASSSQQARASSALELGARYSVLHAGPEIGLLHGPGLELAFTRRSGIELSLRALAEWRLEHELRARGLSAQFAVTSLRGSAGVGWVFGAVHAVSLGFGAGVDFVTVTPEPSDDPTLTPAPARTHLVPMLRAELRYELHFGALWLAAGAFADASLYDTHYDVAEDGRTTRVAAPWAVRPGVLASVGARWEP